MTTPSSAAPPAAMSGVRVTLGPLLAALGAAGAGAMLLAVAPVLAVAVAADGAGTDPAYTAGPVLALLALAPVALAWTVALRGRSGLAAGVLAGLAALAPGRALLDLQLLVAPWRAARPELLVSSSLAPLRPGPGVWLLLLGHLLTFAAGVLALRFIRRASVPPDPPADGDPGPVPSDLPAGGPGRAATEGAGRAEAPAAVPEPRTGSGTLTAAMCVAAVIGAGLVSTPFRSADPYLLPRSAADAPPLVTLGLLALAAAAVVAACLAVVADDTAAGRGALLGLALGIVTVALPPALAAALTPELTAIWGPPAALAGAVALLGIAPLVGRRPTAVDQELRLPALGRLNAAAGALAGLAGLVALLGAALPQVSVAAGLPEPVLYPTRLLVPAGLLLTVAGVALLVGSRSAAQAAAPKGRAASRRSATSARSVSPPAARTSPARTSAPRSVTRSSPSARTAAYARRLVEVARPALAVSWAGMALAGMAVLDATLTATQIGGVHAGPGVWATGLAVLLAPAAACLAALAGGVERDDVDLSELERAAPPRTAGGVLAAALAVPAFGLPLRSAPDYAEAGLWSNFEVGSWGLVAALLAVVAAALLAPWSRPSRAAGLLLGAAAVLAVRLAQLPLTRGRTEDATVAAGAWFGLACLAVLLAGALLAWRERRPGRRHEPSTLRAGRT